ncbi:glycosyltransferase family 4 protein [Alicyclobacillus shizuokensis]|uniref:glycosyltransferase family 4 protein n=1 Tax=Alicyclobacillus shizuokensis TaxID=392014 RepID=UPI00082968CF|nr:glycosyltransferase family 4 protein [Alicyclobacillus shizuokensis]MCL6627261.1 glycosyltransferase family 4 protein [Alicyclobacillus shizuokensis]
MRILLATYWYLPHVGGVSTYVYNLKNELERMGHEVDILAHHPDMQKYYMPNSGRYFEKSKVKDLIYEKVLGFYNQQLSQVDSWIRWREIERYSYEAAATVFGLTKYDLIHTQDIVSTRALWRVKPKHVPLIATIHGCLATQYLIAGEVQERNTLAWSYAAMEEYYGATSSDITIVPTQWLKNLYVNDFNIPSEHLKIIPYGMDIDSWYQNIDQYPKPERPSNKKVIVCSARLVPVKGHECLLQALAMLKEERNDWICWIAGDGPLRKRLEEQAKRMDLKDNIIFLGNRNDVPSLLHQADIFVLSSLQDNQPFSVMEAQVAGKPVVVSDAGGIPEMVVDGETGLISPAGNDELLYRNLKTLIEDDDYRNSIAERGKQRALTQWALETMMDKTLGVYREVGL